MHASPFPGVLITPTIQAILDMILVKAADCLDPVVILSGRTHGTAEPLKPLPTPVPSHIPADQRLQENVYAARSNGRQMLNIYAMHATTCQVH